MVGGAFHGAELHFVGRVHRADRQREMRPQQDVAFVPVHLGFKRQQPPSRQQADSLLITVEWLKR